MSKKKKLKFRWWVEILPSQRSGGDDGWYSEIIFSEEVPVQKREGEPGWAHFLFEEPPPEAIVMVAPNGKTMTYSQFEALTSRERQMKFLMQGFRYIKRYRREDDD